METSIFTKELSRSKKRKFLNLSGGDSSEDKCGHLFNFICTAEYKEGKVLFSAALKSSISTAGLSVSLGVNVGSL